jgi:phosphoglycerate dehydrogenase-like enzyme
MADSNLRVLFAEEDTLFRLMEAALTRSVTPGADRALTYFFGSRAGEASERLLSLADESGLPPGVGVDVATTDEELARGLREADIVVTEKERIDRARLEVLAAGQARLVQKFGRDVDNIDVSAACELGLPVANLARFSTASSAHNVLTLILALARNLVRADESVRAQRDPALPAAFAEGPAVARFNWTAIAPIRVLATQTLGLLGLGENAGAVAQRARAFGMRVIYSKRTRLHQALERELGVEWRERRALLAESDFLSLHVPYEPATESLVDAEFLAGMKPGSFLINTSRGGIVDERALDAALRSGHLGGAGLDVYRYEPVPADTPLLELRNIVWTPHMSGGEPDFMLIEVEDVLANVGRAWRGERPAGLI